MKTLALIASFSLVACTTSRISNDDLVCVARAIDPEMYGDVCMESIDTEELDPYVQHQAGAECVANNVRACLGL